VAQYDASACAILIVKLQGLFNPQSGIFTGVDMDTRSNLGAAKILCVEPYVAVLESRCAVLKYSGFDASSASPRFAEIVLRGREYDLIVLSGLSDFDMHRVIGLADGAEVLVLDGFTMPRELLSLVAQRLDLARQLKV
jgi:hypothetical protein